MQAAIDAQQTKSLNAAVAAAQAETARGNLAARLGELGLEEKKYGLERKRVRIERREAEAREEQAAAATAQAEAARIKAEADQQAVELDEFKQDFDYQMQIVSSITPGDEQSYLRARAVYARKFPDSLDTFDAMLPMDQSTGGVSKESIDQVLTMGMDTEQKIKVAQQEIDAKKANAQMVTAQTTAATEVRKGKEFEDERKRPFDVAGFVYLPKEGGGFERVSASSAQMERFVERDEETGAPKKGGETRYFGPGDKIPKNFMADPAAKKGQTINIGTGDKGPDLTKTVISKTQDDMRQLAGSIRQVRKIRKETESLFLTARGQVGQGLMRIIEKLHLTGKGYSWSELMEALEGAATGKGRKLSGLQEHIYSLLPKDKLKEYGEFVTRYNKWYKRAKRAFLSYRKAITGVAGGKQELKEIATATFDPDYQSHTEFMAALEAIEEDAVAALFLNDWVLKKGISVNMADMDIMDAIQLAEDYAAIDMWESKGSKEKDSPFNDPTFVDRWNSYQERARGVYKEEEEEPPAEEPIAEQKPKIRTVITLDAQGNPIDKKTRSMALERALGRRQPKGSQGAVDLEAEDQAAMDFLKE
jgi:hypothetical protein